MNKSRPRYLASALLALVALLLLWPGLTWLGLIPWQVDTFENRRTAAFPDKVGSLDDWKQWPRRFDAYLDDNLPNRGSLLRLNAWIKYHIFATSPVGNVLVGKEGWLFHRMPADFLEAQGKLERQPYQIRRLRIVLEERRDWLAERGIPYLVLIAPTKQTIYPEKLPDWLAPVVNGGSRRELLQKELHRARSNLELFDFAPVLRASKAAWGDSLYYRHDSHWTYVGALQAYSALARQYPHWLDLPDANWIAPMITRTSNLLQLMGLPGEEITPYPQPVGGFVAQRVGPDTELLSNIAKKGAVEVYRREGGSGKKLYLMGDSFAGWDTAYLAENFSRSVLTNTWGDQWQRYEQFPIEAITAEKPDLVIEQLLENRLDLGVARALLGDSAGANHLPEVRSARLRRLVLAEASVMAEYIQRGDQIEIHSSGLDDARAYIIRLQVKAHAAVRIEALSPYPSVRAWDDLCRRGGEIQAREIEAGRSDILLCIAAPPVDGPLRLRLQPADAVEVLKVQIARHPDV